MANITRIKAGNSKGKTEEQNQPTKIHQETKTAISKTYQVRKGAAEIRKKAT